ncbi:MAG: hypothetical protein KIT17_02925 [Rubrivivax sp.]|nr:hypothetical protein [Rubrivivax sp.]
MRHHVRRLVDHWRLPPPARAEKRRDARGLSAADPGNARVLPALMAWLARAQDHSVSHDGGVARHYSLISGWASSYPETTGYIIPTMLAWAQRSGDASYRERALRMADWLVRIQFPEGGFQGGKVDSIPSVPVTFNTGQVLLGLVAAQVATGRYLEAVRRAADWLVNTQDSDGCWRRHESPFADSGDKQYETHVAWGLFEAERILKGRGYGEAGLRNVRWAIGGMAENGWLAQCCLTDTTQPLTHTLGYALRGIIEAHLLRPDERILDAAMRCARGLLSALRDNGFLPGRLRADWSPSVDWTCLTGQAQIAICWMLLYRITRERALLEAALRSNAFLRRTVHLQGDAPARGGVKGSYPVNGDYGRYEFLNWAAKFLADSLMLETDVTARSIG